MADHGILLKLPLMEIDRFSESPPYRQVAAILKDRIRAGEITDRLPSATDLKAEFGIAELTALKALRVLRAAGWARVSPGLGTYAVPADERPED
jgi:GntR family transcriptional regulator